MNAHPRLSRFFFLRRSTRNPDRLHHHPDRAGCRNPRLRLEEFLERPEANSVGIYILFGENDETERPKAYIGQTGNFGNRLKQHNEKKGLWWNRAVVAFSLTQSLTVTHAHYLEWLAHSHATQAQRFEMDNGTGGTRPHTLPALEAECREIFETIDILLTTLGYPIFEPSSATVILSLSLRRLNLFWIHRNSPSQPNFIVTHPAWTDAPNIRKKAWWYWQALMAALKFLAVLIMLRSDRSCWSKVFSALKATAFISPATYCSKPQALRPPSCWDIQSTAGRSGKTASEGP